MEPFDVPPEVMAALGPVKLKWDRGNDVAIDSDLNSDEFDPLTSMRFVIAPPYPDAVAILVLTTAPGDGITYNPAVGSTPAYWRTNIGRLTSIDIPAGTYAYAWQRDTSGSYHTLDKGLLVVEEPVGGA